jgi:Tn3 transposase DDE domain
VPTSGRHKAYRLGTGSGPNDIREYAINSLCSGPAQDLFLIPSTILKRLAASRNPSQLARALRELGRLERTLFMIEWYSAPALRRRCQAGLNKGEAAHKLKHAVFFHERGEIRDRSFESQSLRCLRSEPGGWSVRSSTGTRSILNALWITSTARYGSFGLRCSNTPRL